MLQPNSKYKYYCQLAGTWKSSDGKCVAVLTDTVCITVNYGGAVLDGHYDIIQTGLLTPVHPQGIQG